MILSKEVEVRISGGNIRHFKNLGYNIKRLDVITVPVEDLPKGSHVKIKVKCDKCGKEKELSYREYFKGFNRYKIYACSQKCAHDVGKNKKTNLERYGIENYYNIEKSKQTKLERYGDENYHNIEQMKKTNLEKYGVKSLFQISGIREKGKITKLKKYGDKNYNNREKFRKTNLERYGNENYNNREKSKQTCLINHGVEWSQQSPEIRKKGKITKKEKYGDENYNNRKQSEETKLNKYGDKNYNNSKKISETYFNKSKEEFEVIKNNRAKTNKVRYGVENCFQSEKIKNKIKKIKKDRYDDEFYTNLEKQEQTKLERYGDKNYHNVEQMKKTNLKNYGVEFLLQSKKIQEKCNQTLFKNHGVENPFQIPEVVDRIFEIKFGIPYDEYLESLPDFIKYKKQVWKVTKKQPFHLLENYEKRGTAGKENSYHLDHKYSMKEGFINNIPPHIIGNIVNIEMLTWEDNISKCARCSITKEELFNLYDNKDKLLKQLTEKYNNRNNIVF